MARYRKIETAMWQDAKFRALSAPGPSAQVVWMYLLMGPRTTIFPGLVVARADVMASDLGWSTAAFLEAFAEASGKGMAKADWTSGVVVLSKALLDSSGDARETAKPESPNVIRGWSKSWSEIPECQLAFEYLGTLASFAEGLGQGFAKAFREAFAKALGKAYPHPSPNQDTGTGVRRESKPPDLGLPDSGASPSGAGERASSTEQPDRRPALESLRTIPVLSRGKDWADERTRLLRVLVPLHVEIFNRTLKAVGGTARPLRDVGPNRLDLQELLDSYESLDGFELDARHVLALREAEALETRSVKFLGAGPFGIWGKFFTTALSTGAGERRGPRVARSPVEIAMDKLRQLEDEEAAAIAVGGGA